MGSINEDRIHKHHDDERDLLAEILHTLRQIRRELTKYTIEFFIGEETMSQTTFSSSLPIGGTFAIAIKETDSASPSFAFVPADISYVSANPSIATVAVNADGSATGTVVGPGTTTITASDSVTGGTGVLTVTLAPPPITFDIVLTATDNPLPASRRQ